MNLATRKINVSRDVVFHEDIFPFTLSTESYSFPSILKSIESVSFVLILVVILIIGLMTIM